MSVCSPAATRAACRCECFEKFTSDRTQAAQSAVQLELMLLTG
jgi:hypothetical protein